MDLALFKMEYNKHGLLETNTSATVRVQVI